MMRALYSAVSGLKTHQTRMDVVGNNIANVNTEAFKSSSVTFSEIMYQTTSSASGGNGATGTGGINAKQIGLGVTTGSTTVSIETPGAAETTGNPFDLKLTDSQTTNFFIVSDGTNTFFTRAGSFYVDGNGYLCMSSTGYTLMGWQVDDTGEIRKDTVSALQVMSAANQISSPEATTKAYASGVLDTYDTNLTSEGGYIMTLGFYDNLGYSYTAKFSIVPSDSGESGEYYISLTDIINQDNTSILKDPNDITGETYLIDPDELFSTGLTRTVTKDVNQLDTNGNKVYTIAGQIGYFTVDSHGNIYSATHNADGTYTTNTDDIVFSGGSFSDGTYTYPVETTTQVTTTTEYPLTPLAGYDDVYEYTSGDTTTTVMVVDGNLYRAELVTDPDTGDESYQQTGAALATGGTFENNVYTISTTNDITTTSMETLNLTALTAKETSIAALPYTIVYDQNKGTFVGIGTGSGATDPSATLKLADVILTNMTSADEVTTSNFRNIEIDFTQSMNYNNNGTSTLKSLKGDSDGDGTGKKLGALTGLTVNSDGRIYGSYDNGNTVLLGQIAVAQFSNASGLEKVGDNCYQTTLNSGEFDGIGVEISADGSSITTGELEMSNVDLSSEFTSMIITQRGFQANSRVITTSDTLLEELINLKR